VSTNQFPNTGQRLGGVRVFTLNLWGQHGAWLDRRVVLIDGLRALRPDLIAFQETIKNEEYDQVIDLLGPGWSVAHQKGRDPEGPAIISASSPTSQSRRPGERSSLPTGCATRLLLGVNRLLNHCRSPHAPKGGGSGFPAER